MTHPNADPAHIVYRDHGCHLHPACLTCPLERCRHDSGAHPCTLRNEARNRQIVELRRQGLAVREIAERVGHSKRRVQYALAAARKADLLAGEEISCPSITA